MALSRRRIALDALTSFGAKPIYSSSELPVESTSRSCQNQTTNDSDTSNIRNHDVSSDQSNDSPIGIIIGEWKIITQNSSIGDERGMENLTLLLEDAADPTISLSSLMASDEKPTTPKEGTNIGRRRLCPPEITFLDAKISIAFLKSNSTNEIRFTAQDALLEWAEAHRYLHRCSTDAEESAKSKLLRRSEYRGVKILQTKDAKQWSERPRDVHSHAGNAEFYYDWTFATPYAGSIHPFKGSINNRNEWKSLPFSHIPFSLLQDTSQPILLYDDITLFEDDLHDNGDVSLNVKVRVMPQCWYILQRLFLRVDYVCIKCSEVRMFCFFGDTNLPGDVEGNTVYRDVVWREAGWDDLTMMSLPTDPARWRMDRENAGAIAGLIGRLPLVELPGDLPRYSCRSIEVRVCST
jgi:hypothetical protein